eukprot:5066851-Amphidinium_carterae.1
MCAPTRSCPTVQVRLWLSSARVLRPRPRSPRKNGWMQCCLITVRSIESQGKTQVFASMLCGSSLGSQSGSLMTGHGLNHFFPKRALRALDSNRRRFPVLQKDASNGHLWPEGQSLRRHVAEKGVKGAFPELPAEVRCLYIVTDQGTVGWTLHFYLLHAGCSLTWSLDPHHRLVNDVRSAIAAAGLQIHQCTATAVLKLQS